MELIQNVPFNYPVLMVSSSDHVTGKSGVPLTIFLSKAGGISTLIAPAVSEIDFGKYALHITPDLVDTIGAWSLHVEAPGCDPFDSLDQVISASTALIPPSAPTTVLDQLKLLLGIALIDSTHDLELAPLIRTAVTTVEGMTKRYFGQPKERIEYRRGHESDTMVLEGYIDDSPEATAAYPSAPPATSLVISRRGWHSTDAWDDLIEHKDWERRTQRQVILLGFPCVWAFYYEYRLRYLDGYLDAPDDIKDAIADIALILFTNSRMIATGMFGVNSEHLGDFSYSRSGLGKNGLLDLMNDATLGTIKRYKRQFV